MSGSHRRARHRKARFAKPDVAARDSLTAGHRVIKRPDDEAGRGRAEVRSVRPYLTASVALVGASVIAVNPVEPPPQIQAVNRDVSLAAAPSVMNIPLNLLKDVINVPYNTVEGLNTFGQSLLFSGTWWIPGSTNVWGTDPGDPAHYDGLSRLIIPFPAMSEALADQWSGIAAVLFPINSGCDDMGCPGGLGLLFGWMEPVRIYELLSTGQFYFDATPVTYPDGSVHPPEGLWNFGGPVTQGATLYDHPEWDTKAGENGDPVVPWAGTTFELDLLSPLTSYVDHLMSDPAENEIRFPTLQEVGTAVWNAVSSLFVAFSPVFPGSPYCLGLCGPGSLLKPPFYYDPPPPWVKGGDPEIDEPVADTPESNAADDQSELASFSETSDVDQGGDGRSEAARTGAVDNSVTVIGDENVVADDASETEAGTAGADADTATDSDVTEEVTDEDVALTDEDVVAEEDTTGEDTVTDVTEADEDTTGAAEDVTNEDSEADNSGGSTSGDSDGADD